MKDQNIYIERIHSYLQNELNEADRKNFEKDLASDTQLAADVALERGVLASIKGVGDRNLKSDISSVHEKLRAEGFFDEKAETTQPQSGKIVRFPMFRILSIAAGLALAMAVAWWVTGGQSQPKNAELFAQYYQPEKTEVQTQIDNLESFGMTGIETTDDSLRNALIFYKKGDYEKANSALEIYTNNHPGDQIGQFYKSLSMLGVGDYVAASQLLGKLSTKENLIKAEDIYWYQALSLLNVPDGEKEAIDIFRKIAESGISRKSEAKSILAAFEH